MRTNGINATVFTPPSTGLSGILLSYEHAFRTNANHETPCDFMKLHSKILGGNKHFCVQDTCLDSSLGRESAFGAGGHKFESDDHTIPGCKKWY